MDRSLEITNRDTGPAPDVEPEDRQQQQRKRRKTSHGVTNPSSSLPPPPPPPTSRWRTGWEQQIFSSNLLSALRRVRSGTPSVPTPAAAAAPRSRAVRDAADRILAAAAGGRSRWSRAVLRRHRTKARAPRRHVHPEPRGPAPAMALLLERERMERKRKAVGAGGGGESSGGNADVLRAKAKVLGRLVPGCRKASFPSLLEETSDYIAALEMQVRAMSALAEMLTSIGSGSGNSNLSSGIVGGSLSTPTSPAGPSRLS